MSKYQLYKRENNLIEEINEEYYSVILYKDNKYIQIGTDDKIKTYKKDPLNKFKVNWFLFSECGKYILVGGEYFSQSDYIFIEYYRGVFYWSEQNLSFNRQDNLEQFEFLSNLAVELEPERDRKKDIEEEKNFKLKIFFPIAEDKYLKVLDLIKD